MNKRLLSVLIFALAVSAVASFILYRLIVTKLTANAKPTVAQVVVASHNLEVGALIKDGDLKTVEWAGPSPKGALANATDVVGRGVIANVYDGEPIMENRLAPRGAGAGLAATIPSGMRAVAVRVNEVAGVAGFVLPGMRVDILIAGNPPGANTTLTGTVTKTLLQNIEVLSAGQNIQKDAEGKPVSVQVVNLLVTPEEAETLSLASNETRIQLVLRNPLDTERSDTHGTAVANLFSGATNAVASTETKPARPRVQRVAAPPPPVAAPPVVKPMVPLTVEVITGSTRVETKFKPEEVKQ
jgi:pilus assembly protein CpaB